MHFDPNHAAAKDSGIFGLPYSETDSKLVLIPVPWEVTTSYGDGTSLGPKHINEASHQVDLFDLEFGNAYTEGIAWSPCPDEMEKKNEQLKPLAKKVVELQNEGLENEQTKRWQAEINLESVKLQSWLGQTAQKYIDNGKVVGVVGGDHSSPLGLIEALAKVHKSQLGVLHLDAHADLRRHYQGFHQSHASIFNNVMELEHPPVKLVQVGIRDFCEEEYTYIKSHRSIETYFDQVLQNRIFSGETWKDLCVEIASKLPEKVYLSIDIDGLDPALCPNTGTPVVGGLSFAQFNFLVKTLVDSGKKIVGFDLCEVAPSQDGGDWNGNVGARVLYKLCGWTLVSQGYRA